jgi:hypothetical protein
MQNPFSLDSNDAVIYIMSFVSFRMPDSSPCPGVRKAVTEEDVAGWPHE